MKLKPKQKLFRAWCPNTKQFIQKDFSIIGETTIFGMLEIYKHELKEKYNLDAVLELEITEFICSHDKMGNKIYEGDILKAPSGNLFLVSWHDENMCWGLLNKDTWYNINSPLYEVIGNIFENPELIKTI